MRSDAFRVEDVGVSVSGMNSIGDDSTVSLLREIRDLRRSWGKIKCT